jgi:hypothetical protein
MSTRRPLAGGLGHPLGRAETSLPFLRYAMDEETLDKADDLLSTPPDIKPIDVLAAKLPS